MGFNDRSRRNDNRPRQGGFRNFSSEQREMHKATCSKCKKECTVPFKPTPGKDVFCKDCYAKKKPRRF